MERTTELLLRNYGGILGASPSPISVLGVRYYEKNYGRILQRIPENSRILEIGPGNGSFIQYLLYKGYKNIAACEIAGDNALSLGRFFGNRIRIVNENAIDCLGNSPDKFDLIYAAQLIEHFTYNNLVKFLEHCYTSLSEGGYIIFETINCANVTHGLYLRYCDYTHRMGFTPRSLKQFLMAIGDFSSIELIEIHPPGFLDCLYYAFRRISGKSVTRKIGRSIGLDNSHYSAGSSKTHGGVRKAMSILLKSSGIRLSRRLSSFLLRSYEFEGIKVYTPFFAVVARKVQTN